MIFRKSIHKDRWIDTDATSSNRLMDGQTDRQARETNVAEMSKPGADEESDVEGALKGKGKFQEDEKREELQ